jgi:AhpD family alkylhydroperoxidase
MDAHETTRIPLDTAPLGLLARTTAWYSRRRYGRVLEPLAAYAHHPGVLSSVTIFELGVQRWHRLSPTLQALATYVPATAIGCSWCVDFGYWVAHHRGVDPAKIRDAARWRESSVHTELERLVLEYAEAMTATPPAVTDGLVARLREHLDDAQLVELTELVAVENLRSRFNAALGLRSQGFSAECPVPGVGDHAATTPI